MQDEQVNSTAGTCDAADSGQTQYRAHAELLQLAAEQNSPQTFYRKALAIIGGYFNSPFAVLHVSRDSDVIDEDYHSGPTDPGFWRGPVHEFLTDSLSDGRPRARLLSARESKLKIALLFAPIQDDRGGFCGAIAVAAACNGNDLRSKLVALRSLATLASNLVRQAPRESASPGSPAGIPSAAGSKAASFESVDQLAFSITNGVRTKMGLEQVSIAFVHGQRCRMRSISGLDHVNPRSPGVQHIVAAMEECLDARTPLAACADDTLMEEGFPPARRLHRQWSESAGGAAVATIPLRAGQQITAVLGIRLLRDERVSPEVVEKIRATIEPLMPMFALLYDARRSLRQHCQDALCRQVRLLFGPGSTTRKFVFALIAITLLWTAFGSVDFTVSARCSVAASVSRVVAAPFGARLAECSVKPGDTVHAGDVLLELDHSELDLQRRQIESQVAVLEQERLRALAESKPVEMRLAEVSLDLERARLALIIDRIERTRIVAPFDGVVVEGDLRQRLGAPLARGEQLMRVAPLDGWKLEIDVPQYAIGRIRNGLTGRFASHARPESEIELQLVSIAGHSDIRERASVYVAEAEPRDHWNWVRPGMEGVAHIDCGPQPVWWVLFHRAIDYLLVNWWI